MDVFCAGSLSFEAGAHPLTWGDSCGAVMLGMQGQATNLKVRSAEAMAAPLVAITKKGRDMRGPSLFHQKMEALGPSHPSWVVFKADVVVCTYQVFFRVVVQ